MYKSWHVRMIFMKYYTIYLYLDLGNKTKLVTSTKYDTL